MSKELKENKKEEVSKKEEIPKKEEIFFSFDRWFSLTGKPTHHKAGMIAFVKGNVRGKRTRASWDEVFKNY